MSGHSAPGRYVDTAFYNLPEAACQVDPLTLTIICCNRKGEALLGPSCVEHAHLLTVLQPWDSQTFQSALLLKNFDSAELRGLTVFTPGGKAVQIDLLVSECLENEKPALIMVFGDATLRIRLEEQLRQAQKMETVGMLAGGIAHDFNNLLTIISGYSHMLATALAGDERGLYAAEQVIKASDRAASLTTQLLSFSRRQVMQSKVLDLRKVVQGMVPMLNRIIGEHIRLSIHPATSVGNIHGDPGQIEQVVMNLVVNARDAMPGGGDITIKIANVELDPKQLAAIQSENIGGYVMLSVSDSGIGMDESTKDQIFEPFFTTKPSGQGTGLGLSTVFSIVKRSGGTVGVTSVPGQGTSVKVCLPRVVASEAVPTTQTTQAAVRGTETVLLVEDEDAVRNIVKVGLELQGYKLLVAASGEEAMRLAKANPGPIHLLIMDIVLPVLNGKEVARRLHKKRPDMIVLFMSGYSDVSLKAPDDPGSKVNFIAKPFTPAALNAKVRQLLDTTPKVRAAPANSTK